MLTEEQIEQFHRPARIAAAVERLPEGQRLAQRQRLVQRQPLVHQADTADRLHSACERAEQPCKDADQARLADTVRAGHMHCRTAVTFET